MLNCLPRKVPGASAICFVPLVAVFASYAFGDPLASQQVRPVIKQPVVQKRFNLVLNYVIKRDDGRSFAGEKIVLQQWTPLGYKGDLFEEGRNFPQQAVDSITYTLGGVAIPYKKDLTLKDSDYWTIKKNPREPREVSQVWIVLKTKPIKEFTIQATYLGTCAQQLAVDVKRQGDFIPALPQQEITSEQRARYTRLSEPGLILRPDEFSVLMKERGLYWDKAKETDIEFLSRVANFRSTFPTNLSVIEHDMQKLIKEKRPTQCNSTSMLLTSILRINGFPVRMTHGWEIDGTTGHAIAQVYVESSMQWIDYAYNPVGTQDKILRFEISRDLFSGNGPSYGRSLGSAGGFQGFDINKDGVGERFLYDAPQSADFPRTWNKDLTPSDPGWITATPRQNDGDVLIQGEKMNPVAKGSWKVETPDWFFYAGEGRYAFLRNGKVGDSVSFTAPVRNGKFKMTGVFFTNYDQGLFDVSVNGSAPRRMDLYSKDLSQDRIELGEVEVKDGQVHLQFKLVGTNNKALKITAKDDRGEHGGMLSFDQIRFEPIK